MRGSWLRGITIGMVAVMLMGMTVLFACPTVTAAEQTAATQATAQEELPSIEQQIRAYAKSLDQKNADDAAASALASHGISGRGKKLTVGEEHALTATLWNSEIFQNLMIDGCAQAILNMQQIGLDSLPSVRGYAVWKSSISAYAMYAQIGASVQDEDRDWKLCGQSPYEGVLNAYDSSLVWMAGKTYTNISIERIQVTETTATYYVECTVVDRFDFSTSGSGGFSDLISGVGALLFNEFDWESKVSFELVAPYSCTHASGAYRWTYDRVERNMISDANGYMINVATPRSFVRESDQIEYWYYELSQTVHLYHDKPWVIEYDAVNANYIVLAPFEDSFSHTIPTWLHRFGTNLFWMRVNHIQMPTELAVTNDYYGVNLDGSFAYDKNLMYTYRLENVLLEKGNMICLTIIQTDTGEVLVDKIALDDYYYQEDYTQEPVFQSDTSTCLNGKDIFISYIGNQKYPLSTRTFDLRIWENGIDGVDGDYMTESVVPPSCAEQGYVTHTCELCGYNYKDTFTDKIDHIFGNWMLTRAPGCETEGVETRTCKGCGMAQTRSVAATGHDFVPHTVEPTCTEQGYLAYVCHCGSAYAADFVDPKGHSWGDWAVTLAPLCTAAGREQSVCIDCNATQTRSIPAPGHTRGQEVVENRMEPTCSAKGRYDTVTYCSVCQAELGRVTRPIAPIAHTYTDEWIRVTDPTCTQRGSESCACAVCGYLATRDLPALGHDHQPTVTPPTCTEPGYTTYACHCGDAYVQGEVDAVGHQMGESVLVLAPTCTEQGAARQACALCGEQQTVYLPATGHETSGAVSENRIEPTCTEPGHYELVMYCTVCGEEEFRMLMTLAARGHLYASAWTVDAAPTCTEAGEQSHHCTRCGDRTDLTELPALGHQAGNAVKEHEIAPTCTEQGQYESVISCTVCHAELERRAVVLQAMGHTPSEAITENVLPATCTEHGQYESVIDCTTCTAELSREIQPIPALGHAYGTEWFAEILPTCEQSGWQSHRCTRCDHATDLTEIAPLGHDFGEWYVTAAPTCTEQGARERTCARCDAQQTEAIAANGHTYADVITVPTCTTQGYTTHTCHCTHEYVDEYVDARGHAMCDWTETAAPTCTAQGTQTRSCTACDYQEQQEIAMLAHEAGDWIVDLSPTVDAPGSRHRACTQCGEVMETEALDALPAPTTGQDTTAPDQTEQGSEGNTESRAPTAPSDTAEVEPQKSGCRSTLPWGVGLLLIASLCACAQKRKRCG